jgi:asparagine synthase (glutamine-hydrolysing)
MPGIAGLISRQRPDVCQRLVDEMIASMQHEKFYVSGTHSAPELGVFAGWVALEGSFADRQPLFNDEADIGLILSGECFSDTETRTRLKGRGHRFEGDTAGWLVHLYEARNEKFFEDLNGLFSGLLIDRRQRKVFLFNDRYGMERLYFHEGRDALFFASEAKALLRILPDLRAFDEDAVSEFLAYGCTLGWKSLFRGIRVLPGASLWSFDGSQWDKRLYFVPETWEAQSPLSVSTFADELEATFSRILPPYFAPDGQIGVSLTGGLDTRMIMACRPATTDGLVSYTFGGADRDTLDVQLAARVAAACHVPHHVLRIGHDFFSDFASLVDRTVYITDGSFGACGAHEVYLHAQARGRARVRLTGNYGSEILRGATTFKPAGLSEELLDERFRGRVPELAEAHAVSFAAFQEIPWHLFGVLRAAQSQVSVRTPYLDNDIVSLAYRAPERLRRSSSPILQVIRHKHSGLSRIPADSGLVPASRLASAVNYLWSRASFKLDYWSGEGMPHWVSFLDSHGLRLWVPGLHKYLHYSRWFRNELARYLREQLTASRHQLWPPKLLDRLANDHIDGRKNYVRELDAVLTLEAIDRLLLRQTPGSSTW